MNNLLVELLVEELPPKALSALGTSFANTLANSLKEQGLAPADAVVTPYASPRRLAVHVTGVLDQAPIREGRDKLMPVSIAFDAEGRPTEALRKRLTKAGRGYLADTWPNLGDTPDQLLRESDGKVETVYLRFLATGTTLRVGLINAMENAIEALPIPKVMSYQLADGWTTVKFVRPAHGLVALHGANVVPIEALGLHAGRQTHGHRFEAQADPIVLRDADSYAAQLRDEGAVIASFAERRAEIQRQLRAAAAEVAAEHAGATSGEVKPIEDDALLDEVTALVERPNVLVCEFDREFLGVPQECLILTMKANQKYFPLLDALGKLTHRFLVVSNITPIDPGAVKLGNERVVRPRLADAKFFFDQDRKKRLEDRVPRLGKVVYHAKLGSQGERVERVRAIACSIAKQLGESADRIKLVDRAALLAKADLLTDMVGEFPELQGIMGHYYALHDGEDAKVAEAIEDHYRPRFAGDELPRNDIGLIVALADKLETLVGLFATGEKPTGDKDPFALRRHALGVIRMLDEGNLPLTLTQLIDAANCAMPPHLQGDWATVSYILERAEGYYIERGFDARAIDATIGPLGASSPLPLLREIMGIASSFIASKEGQILAEANKRITNILKKTNGQIPLFFSPHDLREKPNPLLFQLKEEVDLHAALLLHGEASLALREQKRFGEALSALVPLHEPVRHFFDNVMVNVEQADIRDNRITLLQHARAYMNLVADLSRMAG